jgi:hypothetical protein
MSGALILSIFPGGDMLGMAFEQAKKRLWLFPYGPAA